MIEQPRVETPESPNSPESPAGEAPATIGQNNIDDSAPPSSRDESAASEPAGRSLLGSHLIREAMQQYIANVKRLERGCLDQGRTTDCTMTISRSVCGRAREAASRWNQFQQHC